MDWNVLTDDEKLIAEQAIAMVRAVKLAGEKALHGKGLFDMEQAVLDRGRELLRTTLERSISAHPEAQKRGSVAGRAPAARSSGAGACGRVRW